METNLIKIWKNKNKILEGIKNSIFTQEHIEVIANERKEICDKCPHKTENKECGLCGCVLHIKQRSLSSSCDDKRWDAVLTEEEDDNLNNSLNLT